MYVKLHFMSKRHRAVHKDTIEDLLDKVSLMREELVAIERSLERMQMAKPEITSIDSSRKSSPRQVPQVSRAAGD